MTIKLLFYPLCAALLIAGLSSAASAGSTQTGEPHHGSDSGAAAVEEALEDMPPSSESRDAVELPGSADDGLEMTPPDESSSELRGSVYGLEVLTPESTGTASELRGSVNDGSEMPPADINTEIQSELRGPVDDVEMPVEETIPAEEGGIGSPED
jgi:hypothetical protein